MRWPLLMLELGIRINKVPRVTTNQVIIIQGFVSGSKNPERNSIKKDAQQIANMNAITLGLDSATFCMKPKLLYRLSAIVSPSNFSMFKRLDCTLNTIDVPLFVSRFVIIPVGAIPEVILNNFNGFIYSN